MSFLKSVWEGFVAFIKSIGSGIIQILKGIFKVVGAIVGALAGILGGLYSMVAKGFYKLYMVLLKPKNPAPTIDTSQLDDVNEAFERILDQNPEGPTIYFDPEDTAFAVIKDENNKVTAVKAFDIDEVPDRDVIKRVLNTEGIATISPMTN